MQNAKPLFWGQGLFLTPQHLQQQDIYNEGQRLYLWRIGNNHGWGIRRLKIREEGLADYSFDITECELISSTGVVIRTGRGGADQNSQLAPRRVEDYLDPSGHPLCVYLGIPRYQRGHSNLAGSAEHTPPGATPSRFRLVERTQEDSLDPDAPEIPIGLLEYNVSLLFDREETFPGTKDSYDLVKIAEVLPAPEGKGARLSSRFIPPSLTIDASSVLFERLQGVRDLLAARAREFAEMKRQRGVRATAHTIQETVRLQMLQTLSRFIPLFQHHLESGAIHPEAMYLLLRQIVGELSVYSEEVSVFGALTGEGDSSRLLAYDHNDLWNCYDIAIARIFFLVNALTAGPELGIRLTYTDEYYQAALPDEVFEGENVRYYLMIDSLIEGEKLTALLQRTGKISTLTDMPRLRDSALFGLKISYLPVPPEELPQRGGQYKYFAVDPQSQKWRLIREAKEIAVYCGLDPRETVMKLLFVRGD